MNKKILQYLVVGAVSLSVVGSVAVASAYAADTNSQTNRIGGLVSALSQKFGINQTDLQTFLTQYFAQKKADRQATMNQNFTAKVNAAVTAGKLTSAQAAAITAKKTELETFRASLQGKTKAEIQAALKTEMQQLQQWAQTNNIPANYLRMFGGFRMKLGMWNSHK